MSLFLLEFSSLQFMNVDLCVCLVLYNSVQKGGVNDCVYLFERALMLREVR